LKILGVQISSVHFPKNGSSCCEWFIADFGGFREVKHLLIIFSLYRFEFHTKTLIFTVFEMSKFMVTLLQLINHVGNDFDVSRMEISALKTSLALDSQKNSKTKN